LDKLSLLINVAGLIVLFVTLGLGTWFGCAAIFRLFLPRSAAEQVFLPEGQPLPAWYKRSMQGWVKTLWP